MPQGHNNQHPATLPRHRVREAAFGRQQQAEHAAADSPAVTGGPVPLEEPRFTAQHAARGSRTGEHSKGTGGVAIAEVSGWQGWACASYSRLR